MRITYKHNENRSAGLNNTSRRENSPELLRYRVKELNCNPETTEIFNRVLKNIFYHGTSRNSAMNIYKNGFSVEGRQDGATSILTKHCTLTDDASSKHIYFSSDPDEAAKYAKMHADPMIISMVLPQEFVSEKCKPDLQAGTNTALHTKHPISRKWLLKNDPSSRKLKKIFKRCHVDPLKKPEREKFRRFIRDNLLPDALQPRIAKAEDLIGENAAFMRLASKAGEDLSNGETKEYNLEDLERMGLI